MKVLKYIFWCATLISKVRKEQLSIQNVNEIFACCFYVVVLYSQCNSCGQHTRYEQLLLYHSHISSGREVSNSASGISLSTGRPSPSLSPSYSSWEICSSRNKLTYSKHSLCANTEHFLKKPHLYLSVCRSSKICFFRIWLCLYVCVCVCKYRVVYL